MPPISKVVQLLPQPVRMAKTVKKVKTARLRLPPRLPRQQPSLQTRQLRQARLLVPLLVLATEAAGSGLGFFA
jgi:hypothetical protein